MFLRQTQEDCVSKNERLIQELEISLGKLEIDLSQNFRDLGISPEEIQSYFDDRDNFSDEEWEEVVRIKNELNQRLDSKSLLSSAKSVREVRAALPKDNRWIYVR
jgi:DNA-binding transcriptional MerR regulator